MGQEPKKYHISDNGDIFKVNEDGSFTELGNAEELDKSLRQPAVKNKTSKFLWPTISLVILAAFCITIYMFSTAHDSDDYINYTDASDSTSFVAVSNGGQYENPDFDEWREHVKNYIYDLQSSPAKSKYDTPTYSATDNRIYQAIDLFYGYKYAEVEEYMFYPAYRQNNATAQYYLGCIYENGGHGIAHDSKTAFYWFEQAALNGYPKAMYYLARDYYRDKENKLYWMQKAADAGDMEARYFGMAHSYEEGIFTPVDLNKALQLYEDFAKDYGTDYWLVGKDIERVKSKLVNIDN
ncbi:MAG: sel1 repeat family protein [Clostridiales bacterium]|nr:sel1 repeat family protein [Clostridiales bacterium]